MFFNSIIDFWLLLFVVKCIVELNSFQICKMNIKIEIGGVLNRQVDSWRNILYEYVYVQILRD